MKMIGWAVWIHAQNPDIKKVCIGIRGSIEARCIKERDRVNICEKLKRTGCKQIRTRSF